MAAANPKRRRSGSLDVASNAQRKKSDVSKKRGASNWLLQLEDQELEKGGVADQLVQPESQDLAARPFDLLRHQGRYPSAREALIYPRSQLPCSISADCSADEADDLRLSCLHREEEADAA